ncbi:MAG: GntR family transcriptional regulator [Oligosphaeraceae bacterium]|nr:GntR family transcriptional regulator [Oligosphaeraceae bacterium]
MLQKTTAVERYLLERITDGTLVPRQRIPSQQQLMDRCTCSRTTVVRALKNLARSGHISSRKGSGAFVRPGPYGSEIKSLVIIGENRENSPMFPFSEMLFSLDTGDLPVRWISNNFALGNASDYFQPGQAIIWLLPSENQVLLMRYLRQKGFPQLLINRSYEDFDYICTEVRESLEEGLTWLLQESGPELAFLSKLPGSRSPYLNERIIAFYEVCLELGAILSPKAIFKQDYTNLADCFENIGRKLFAEPNFPRSIFVMSYELAVPTVLCAARYGLALEKDYTLLIFDIAPELIGQKGIAMMRQPLHFFRQSIEKWLQIADTPDRPRFAARRKTDLVY